MGDLGPGRAPAAAVDDECNQDSAWFGAELRGHGSSGSQTGAPSSDLEISGADVEPSGRRFCQGRGTILSEASLGRLDRGLFR